jgi:hypothetical protein
MFHLRYSIFPTDAHPERERLGEGLVNCWIDRPTLDEADATARADVQGRHWQILEREDAKEVSAADYADNSDWLLYYQQALIDKTVYVYHLSPRHPVYWVTLAIEQRTPAERALAHFFLSGESIMTQDEDVFDPDFWKGEPRQVALDAARQVLEDSGWSVLEVVTERGCAPQDLAVELAFAFDEAEESGSCLVIEHEGDPEESA